MALVSSASRAEPVRLVPVYFVSGRTEANPRTAAMVPDTVLEGIADPKTVLNEASEDQAMAFEPFRPIPVVTTLVVPRVPGPGSRASLATAIASSPRPSQSLRPGLPRAGVEHRLTKPNHPWTNG